VRGRFASALLALAAGPGCAGAPGRGPRFDDSVERRVLIEARQFATGPIGDTAETPDELIAFQNLLESEGGRDAFAHVHEKAGAAGRLYALCGLYFLDRPMFDRKVRRIDKGSQVTTTWGCTGETVEVGSLLKELKSGKTSSELRKAAGELVSEQALERLAGDGLGREIARLCDEKERRPFFIGELRWRAVSWGRVDEAVSRLIALLHGEESCRLGAIWALGILGPWAARAGPDLATILISDATQEVKDAAASALCRVDRRRAVEAGLLSDEDEE
jgi:hypothetical protein